MTFISKIPRFITSLLATAILLLPHQPLRAHDENHLIKIGTGIFAAASFLGYGCYRWYKSNGVKKATARINSIKKDKKRADKTYKRLANLMQSHVITEDILENIVQELPTIFSLDRFFNNLDAMIKQLHNDKKYVSAHNKQWQSDCYYVELNNQVHNLRTSIKDTARRLLHLQKMLNIHKPYLKLSLMIEELEKKYQSEICIIETDPDVKQKLNIIVQSKHFEPSVGFPLVSYAEDLGPDLKNLKNLFILIRSSNYPKIKRTAESLLTALHYCKDYIATHPDYQRQRAEHAHFMQNEQLVKARQKEVEEIAKKNRLESERLHEERRKNNLLEQKIDSALRQTRECKQLQRYMPSVERIIFEIHETINQEKREISYLNQELQRLSGISPECYDFSRHVQSFLQHQRQLHDLDVTLDRLLKKLKDTTRIS